MMTNLPGPTTRRLAFAALLFLSAACSAGYSTTVPDDAARPARNVPERFVFDPSIDVSNDGTENAPVCYNPMVDPRDGRRIRLVRAASDRGDYEAPVGSYGLEQGELLRLECSTGRVIGIVAERVKSR